MGDNMMKLLILWMVSMEREISHIHQHSPHVWTWHHPMHSKWGIKSYLKSNTLPSVICCKNNSPVRILILENIALSYLFMSQLSSSQANLLVICINTAKDEWFIPLTFRIKKQHNLPMNSTAVLQMCMCGSPWDGKERDGKMDKIKAVSLMDCVSQPLRLAIVIFAQLPRQILSLSLCSKSALYSVVHCKRPSLQVRRCRGVLQRPSVS